MKLLLFILFISNYSYSADKFNEAVRNTGTLEVDQCKPTEEVLRTCDDHARNYRGYLMAGFNYFTDKRRDITFNLQIKRRLGFPNSDNVTDDKILHSFLSCYKVKPIPSRSEPRASYTIKKISNTKYTLTFSGKGNVLFSVERYSESAGGIYILEYNPFFKIHRLNTPRDDDPSSKL